MQVVPQYIDVEDKIAGPLTWKHLGWFFGAGAILVVLWNMLDKFAFWLSAIPVVLITVAFAFYRPYGVTLASFIAFGFLFIFRPNLYVWQREGRIDAQHKEAQKTDTTPKEKKQLTMAEVHGLTKALDSHGEARSTQIEALIRQNAATQKKTKK